MSQVNAFEPELSLTALSGHELCDSIAPEESAHNWNVWLLFRLVALERGVGCSNFKMGRGPERTIDRSNRANFEI